MRKRKAPSSRSSSSTSPAAPSRPPPTKCSEESNGEYTITFEFLPADADGQREQLVRRLGAEDPSIDILGMDVIWTAEFANAGWIQPWEGELESQVTENVFDSVVEGASFEDTLYAAPFTSNTQLLWYRKDRVEQVPETWDQMLEEAERIGENGSIQVQGEPVRGLRRLGELDDRVRRLDRCSTDPETVGLDQEATEKRDRDDGPLRDLRRRGARHRYLDRGHRAALVRGRGRLVHAELSVRLPECQGERARRLRADSRRRRTRLWSKASRRHRRWAGINLGVSEFSENSELAFEAAACMVEPENQLEAAKLGGLPPTREDAL